MAIIINYDLPDNITVNILPTGETVVNVLPKSPIVVNLCNDNGQSTTDYAALTGKPKINDVELSGNKTLAQLGIEPKRGIDDFYVTNAEKTQGALATGNSTLDTVKKVADKVVLDSQVIQEFTTTVATNGFDILTDKFGNSLNLTYGTYILNYLAPNGGSGSGGNALITFNNVNTGQNFRQNSDTGTKQPGLLVSRQDRQYFMYQIIFTFLSNGRIISWYDGISVANDADTVPADSRFKSISLVSYGASITKISMLAVAGLTVNAGVVVQLLKVK